MDHAVRQQQTASPPAVPTSPGAAYRAQQQQDQQPGLEMNHFGTPGLEVVGQDMDNFKSNLTPPPMVPRDVHQQSQHQQPPANGYFAPPSNHGAHHPTMTNDQAYASGRQPAHPESYSSAPTTHVNEGHYNNNNNLNPHNNYDTNHHHQHFDAARTTMAPSMRTGHTGPMSDGGLPYSPMMDEKQHDDRSRSKTTVCGVYPATFFLSLVLAAVVLIAAIGGGVGGTLAVKEARNNALAEAASSCSSSRATATSGGTASTTSSDAAAAVTSTSSLARFKNPGQVITELDCPAMDNKNMIIKMRGKDVTFTPQCGTDYYSNQIDLISTVAYSFENCVRACAAANSYGERAGLPKNQTCIAVVFNANMLSNVDLHGGNCWLKAKIGAAATTPGLDTVAAALLVKDP